MDVCFPCIKVKCTCDACMQLRSTSTFGHWRFDGIPVHQLERDCCTIKQHGGTPALTPASAGYISLRNSTQCMPSRICVAGHPSNLQVLRFRMRRAWCNLPPFRCRRVAAPASRLSGAIVERADTFGAMITAYPSCFRVGVTAFGRVSCCRVLETLPSHSDGDARVRCAVSKGAVFLADKLTKGLRSVAVWIGAGQLHRLGALGVVPFRRHSPRACMPNRRPITSYWSAKQSPLTQTVLDPAFSRED